MTRQSKAENATVEPIEQILAEIAIGVQLTSTEDKKARERYEAIRNWIERDGSPLHDRVEEFYPQGSMAIGATIRARRSDEEYDVDIVVQVKYTDTASMDPEKRLNELYEAVRGKKGSRYYDATKKQSRCVTIIYRDGMRLDMVPAKRRWSREEKVSVLPHAPGGSRSPENRNYIGNSFGLAEWFKRQAGKAGAYGRQFAEFTRQYELAQIHADADVQEIPEREPPQEKGLTVVGLQLIKRFRNEAYKGSTAKPPPSVILARFAGEARGQATTLLDELVQQTSIMMGALAECRKNGDLLHMPNPICPEDILTDRWPRNQRDQEIWHSKLQDLEKSLIRLKNGDLSLREIEEVCAKIFGMEVSQKVIAQYADRHSAAVKKGDSTSIGPSGRLLPVAGLGMSVPRHTFYGK